LDWPPSKENIGGFIGFLIAEYVGLQLLAAIQALLAGVVTGPTAFFGLIGIAVIALGIFFLLFGFGVIKLRTTKLSRLESALSDVITKRDTTFRERVNKYVLLEAEAEALLQVSHADFYVNPDLMVNAEQDSPHLTDLAVNLLQAVKQAKLKSLKPPKPPRESALRFSIISTTDWFEVGIANGSIKDTGPSKVTSGTIRHTETFSNYFHVNHADSPLLKMWAVATVEYPRGITPLCLLRKGNKGHLDVSIRSVSLVKLPFGKWAIVSHWILGILSGWVYETSPKEKNEVTFPLW